MPGAPSIAVPATGAYAAGSQVSAIQEAPKEPKSERRPSSVIARQGSSFFQDAQKRPWEHFRPDDTPSDRGGSQKVSRSLSTELREVQRQPTLELSPSAGLRQDEPEKGREIVNTPPPPQESGPEVKDSLWWK